MPTAITAVNPPSTTPFSHRPERKAEEDQLDADDRGDGRERDHAGRVDVADTGPSHAATVAAAPASLNDAYIPGP